MSVRPEIVTINEVDSENGDKVDVSLWAIRNFPDAHPAGVTVWITGKDRSLEFNLTTAEVASLLSDAVSIMDNEVNVSPEVEPLPF